MIIVTASGKGGAESHQGIKLHAKGINSLGQGALGIKPSQKPTIGGTLEREEQQTFGSEECEELPNLTKRSITTVRATCLD